MHQCSSIEFVIVSSHFFNFFPKSGTITPSNGNVNFLGDCSIEWSAFYGYHALPPDHCTSKVTEMKQVMFFVFQKWQFYLHLPGFFFFMHLTFIPLDEKKNQIHHCDNLMPGNWVCLVHSANSSQTLICCRSPISSIFRKKLCAT